LDLIATLTTTKFSKYLFVLLFQPRKGGLRKNKIKINSDVNGSVKTARIVEIQMSI
jgi:hypothetical protein